MFKTSECIKNDKGFTLVELMVTVLLTAIAVVSIYRGYTAFSQSADAQQQVIEMQQNLRIGMNWLVADIRRAGMNEEGEDAARFMCDEVPTNDTSIEFSMDLLGGDNVGNDDDDDALDELVSNVSGMLIGQLADKVESTSDNGRATLKLVFDH